jgi:hypothetical protein
MNIRQVRCLVEAAFRLPQDGDLKVAATNISEGIFRIFAVEKVEKTS